MKGLITTLIIIAILFGAIGWLCNDLYRDLTNKRSYNGLWIPQNLTYKQAMSDTQEYDTIGSWICVNIKGMSIKDMITTCEHEASHEIFAQKCQTNATLCLQEVGLK